MKDEERPPIHDNPTKPRTYQKIRRGKVEAEKEHWARAPYNFVPLPDKMVPAPAIPRHDDYRIEEGDNRLTGYLDISLETGSYTYIRGMENIVEFQIGKPEKSKEELEKLSDAEKKAFEDSVIAWKERRAEFYSSLEDAHVIEGKLIPAIPGSTIRGMVRHMVEVVGHGRMSQVGPKPTYTYRAVAVQGQDPLKEPYAELMGDQNNRQVKAGYLKKRGRKWFIQPALNSTEAGWDQSDAPFIRIAEEDIFPDQNVERGRPTVRKYKKFGFGKKYTPQIHQVTFEKGGAVRKTGRRIRGNPMRSSIVIQDFDKNSERQRYHHSGWLVCAGNMLETGGRKSPRKRQVIMFAENPKWREIPIADEVIEGYLNGLSTYAASAQNLKAWNGGQADRGCLGHDKPIFYITDKKGNIKFFGHNPNFRVPGFQDGENRATNPVDLIPKELLNADGADFAEAMFGWVWDKLEVPKVSKFGSEKPNQFIKEYAGRVFFEDAQFENASGEIWYRNGEPVTPKILSTPRPTTFQHYLTQDGSKGHDPNVKMGMAWYGTKKDKNGRLETSLRGYKHYWHKGKKPQFENTDSSVNESQLTRIIPLNPGVLFKSRIYFENLSPQELGLLLWVLNLPKYEGEECLHKIGMGKPLGLGAIRVSVENLILSKREERYQTLFSEGNWALAEESQPAEKVEELKLAFETYVLGALGKSGNFIDEPRIGELLTMLKWVGDRPSAEWLDWTRYMQIEHPELLNEYVERPVLPTPKGVIRQHTSDNGLPANKACENSKGDPNLTLERIKGADQRKIQRRNENRRQRPHQEQRQSNPSRNRPSQTTTLSSRLDEHEWLRDAPVGPSVSLPQETAKKEFEVGMQLKTIVTEAFPKEPVFLKLEKPSIYVLPSGEDIELFIWIQPENLAGKLYKPGNKASVEILSVDKSDENGEWIINCQPRSKKK